MATHDKKNNDLIVGQVTNLSNENKKKKYFVKFSLITQEQNIIDGWIFSTTSGILTTPLGQAIQHSMKTNSGIKLWGSLEQTDSTYIHLLVPRQYSNVRTHNFIINYNPTKQKHL